MISERSESGCKRTVLYQLISLISEPGNSWRRSQPSLKPLEIRLFWSPSHDQSMKHSYIIKRWCFSLNTSCPVFEYFPKREVLLTCSAGLVSWGGPARQTLTHRVNGDDPELIVDEGGELQDDWIQVSRVSGQVLPPARFPVVLFELDQELCRETHFMAPERKQIKVLSIICCSSTPNSLH